MNGDSVSLMLNNFPPWRSKVLPPLPPPFNQGPGQPGWFGNRGWFHAGNYPLSSSLSPTQSAMSSAHISQLSQPLLTQQVSELCKVMENATRISTLAPQPPESQCCEGGLNLSSKQSVSSPVLLWCKEVSWKVKCFVIFGAVVVRGKLLFEV